MPERGKMDLLHKEAAYIGKRHLNGQVAILFQLESFYVEVFYREYRTLVDYINTTGSIEVLIPYLNQLESPVANNKKP